MSSSNRKNPKPKDKKTVAECEDARQRLIEAGMDIFGRYSYEGASTRMIAERAAVNIAAIPYYFGGKEGLYHAVIQSMLDKFGQCIRPTLDSINDALTQENLSPETLFQLLGRLQETMLDIILSGKIPQSWMRLITSEDTGPASVFDVYYNGAIRHTHETATRIIARLLKLPEDSDEAIIRTHAIMGQMLTFHHGGKVILRRLNHPQFSAADAALVHRVIAEHTRTILADRLEMRT